MNIVTESRKNETPTSIKDCLKTDEITKNLWTWAERLEKLGKILFWTIIISGIIIALGTSIETVEKSYGTYTYERTEFSFSVFLTAILQTALYAFIEYCSYHVLALLISSLASITQNTKTTAKLMEYVTRKKHPEKETVKIVINIVEKDDRGRREVTETILETDFAYESSTPTLNDLLVKLQDAGKIKLVTEADGDNVIITGINDLVPKTDETETTMEDYDWYVYINDGDAEDNSLSSTKAIAANDTVTITYMHYSRNKEY
mgnify:CR=1 FL=1